MTSGKELRLLHAEVLKALEVSIVGRAPPTLIEELAATAGLLEAFAGLSPHAMGPLMLERATRDLALWAAWHSSTTRIAATA